ncbi:hypothetical protein ACA910_018013 [Epithemia clementina (nom. ined.)]
MAKETVSESAPLSSRHVAVGQKEEHQHQQQRRTRRRRGDGNLTSRRKHDPVLREIVEEEHQDYNKSNIIHGNGNLSPTSSSKVKTSNHHNNQNLDTSSLSWMKEFQLACQDPAVASMEFWKQQSPQVASVIFSASMQLDAMAMVDHSSLLLDGLAPSLLQVSTQMVQQAMSIPQQKEEEVKSNDKSTNSRQSLLLVAIHGLRAIVRRLVPKIDKVLKTLYHALILSSEQAIQTQQQGQGASFSYADLCWKATEAIKVILLMSYCHYSPAPNPQISDKDDMDSATDIRYITFSVPPKTEAQSLFPIPRPWSLSTQPCSSSLVLLDLTTMDKLVTIAVQACIAVIKLLLHLASLEKEGRKNSEMANLVQAWRKRNPSKSLSATTTTLQQWALHLTTSTVMEWIGFFSSKCNDQKMGIAKKLYRIVWDQASQNQAPEEALVLRQTALRILLLNGNINNNNNNRQLAELLRGNGVWEMACTSAWKVACTFQQQQQHRGSSSSWRVKLKVFHEKVGAILDQLALGLPMPYLEYCAHRFCHAIQSDSVLPTPPCVYRDDGLDTFRVFKPTMQLLFLSLQIKQVLSTNDETTQRNWQPEFEDLVVKEFQSANFENLPMDDLRRILKLFNVISLHRTIYTVLSVSPDSNQLDSAALKTAARLSIQCLGPLYLQLIANSTTSDLPPNTTDWELYVETMIRGIGAYEWLLRNGDPSVRRICDSAMIAITNVLVQDTNQCSPPLLCIEKTAKTLAIQGRKRAELGDGLEKYAATPLLLSIRLFACLDQPPPPSLQLSARWSELSSLFRSVDKVQLETMCIFAALREHAVESSKTTDSEDHALSLLQYLGHRCHGNIPHLGFDEEEGVTCIDENDKSRESLVTRLLLNFRRLWNASDDYFHYSDDALQLTNTMATPMLVEGILGDLTNAQRIDEYIESKFDSVFTLPSLCGLFFLGNDKHYSWFQSFKTSMTILRKVAKYIVLNQTIEDGEEEATIDHGKLKDEYEYLGNQTVTSLERLSLSNTWESTSAAIGLLYLVLSSSLIAYESIVEPDCWNWSQRGNNGRMPSCKEEALQLARLAVKHLEQGDDVVHELVQEMIQFYLLRLECNGGMHRVGHQEQTFSKISLLCQEWLEKEKESSSSRTVQWLEERVVAFLSRYSDWLSYRGDYLEALHLASLNLALGRRCRFLAASFWLESRSLSHVNPNVAVPYNIIAMDCSTHEVEKPFDTVCDSRLSSQSIEVEACRIRHKILTAIDNQENDFYREKLDGLLSSCSEHSDSLSRDWTKSTIILGLADISQKLGDFVGALCYTRKALQLCQKAAGGRSDIHSQHISAIMLSNRELECLARAALLYADLGDRKKADLYALEFAQHINLLWSEQQHGGSVLLFHTEREREVQRLLSLLRDRKTSLSNIAVEVESNGNQLLNPDFPYQVDHLNLQNLLRALDRAKPYERSAVRMSPWLDRLEQAKLTFDRFHENKKIKMLTQTIPTELLPSPHFELALNKAKACFSVHGTCDDNNYELVKRICSDLCQQPSASSLCRAEAWYLLGLLEIGNARRSGTLYHLWGGYSNVQLENDCKYQTLDDSSVRLARSFFKSALAHVGPASTILSRNVLRSLILVIGPGNDDSEMQAMGAQALLHVSIGASHRMHIARSLDESEQQQPIKSSDLTVQDAFQLLDTPASSEEHSHRKQSFFATLARLSRRSWRFVGACLCPTGEMIVSSWCTSDNKKVEVSKLACVFPDGGGLNQNRRRIYDSVVLPLDKIICKSQQHIDETKQNPPSTRDEISQWWKTRREMDNSLKILLEQTEQEIFSSSRLKEVLFGDETQEGIANTGNMKESSINISTGFAAYSEHMSDISSGSSNTDHRTIPTRQELESWKVAQLKAKLVNLGCTNKELRNIRKDVLIDMLFDKWREERCRTNTISVQERQAIESIETTTILVLDEHLQRFPFESLPSFEGKEVCRVPSLPFALAKLCDMQKDNTVLTINTDRTSYVLDPESNLPATRERINTSLRSLSVFQNSMWEGIVGENPSNEFMVRGLSQNNGLFLYYGHGGTQMFFSPSDLQRMLEADESGKQRQLRAAVVLMGCSSGRLESVIREGRQDSLLGEQFLPYLPEGMALSYLAAGAPCVVGNLWDVTDVDIDRFAIRNLEMFLEEEATGNDSSVGGSGCQSLAKCVALSRSSCKLRFLTGSAPVYYGLPVHRM